ncbi:hypothetical protein MUN89_01855 [Halobacillus salinarum]|uniref:YfhD-like protein n=1 Tax=Halobacillus salinarum TaxID=2932257 RepID=A0ABY4EJW6_9BACI|nr:hypothetical protein [Halobacillus salinarum]UOQ44730.1 hypothetical protein MUN89_01855 [Halobacillus salinarum]
MPKETSQTHAESSPHRDGAKEGFYNDDKGIQMGVTAGKAKNPELNLQPDEDMKEFKEHMEELTEREQKGRPGK